MLRQYPQMIDDRQNPYSVAVRRLWAAVVNQAVDDIAGVPYYLDKESRHYKTLRKEDATAWFESTRTGCGSFLWICGEVLHLDPAQIRTTVLNGGQQNEKHFQGALPKQTLDRRERRLLEM